MTTAKDNSIETNAAVVRADTRDYRISALVGRETVLLGWSVAEHVDRSDLLGFGVKRCRLDPESWQLLESEWVTQERHFQSHNGHGRRQLYSTRTDPLQQFSWCDNSVEPGFAYRYSVAPVRGTPALLQFEAPVSVELQTQAAVADQIPIQLGASVNGAIAARNGAAVASGADANESMMAAADVQYLDRRCVASAVAELVAAASSCVLLYSSTPLVGRPC